MPSPARVTYDRMAEVYDRRWSGYTEATLRATLEGLELEGRERILDLAAGTGELADRLLKRWPDLDLVGLDLSPAMLRQANTKPGLRAWKPVEGDAARLPFNGPTFDLILCANALHHFPDPRGSLAEIRRVLRPGGRLILTDWCADYLSVRLLSAYLRLTDRSFRQAFSLGGCRLALEAAGFVVRDARRFKIDRWWGLMRVESA